MATSLPHPFLSLRDPVSKTSSPVNLVGPTTTFLRRHPWQGSGLRLHTTRPSLVITSALPSSSSSPSPSSSSTTTNATTTNDNSLTSIITGLEREKKEAEEEIEEEATEDPSMRLDKRWKEIAGRDDWAGILDPIDPLLRRELIRIGEFAQACYDAYDFDHFSMYCGSCRYNRRKFFESLDMADSGYEVTRYLFATSNIKLPNFFMKSRLPTVWSECANWIGYVAVSNDEETKRIGRRDIIVAWRGTVTRLEWIADLMDYLIPVSSEGVPCPDPKVKVESGFLNLYTDKDPDCRFCKFSAREQILTEVRRLAGSYPGEEMSLTITGHSLGAALAVLSAYDVAETGVNFSEDGREIPISVVSFAGPRVGNGTFKNRVEDLGVKVLRVVNVHDKVPQVPGILMNERVPDFVRRFGEWLPWYYSHVGVELELNHKNSPFLRDTGDISCFHNLEAHLHLLDGYHGKGQRFVLTTGRDPALVNKSSDFLKDHHLVPPYWRQDHNKGMVRNHEGRWKQPERSKLEDHPEDIEHHYHQLGLGSSNFHIYRRN